MPVEVSGEPVALFNIAGKFHAIHNTCVHRGAPLAEGELDAEIVTCPWHFWQYDVTTGQCKTNPDASVRSYETKIENGEILIAS